MTIQRILIAAFTVLFITNLAFAQKGGLIPPPSNDNYSITGPQTPADLGSTVQYYVDYSVDGPVAGPNWFASGGTVTSTWTANSRYYANVQWNTVGNRTLQFRSNTTVKATDYVTVLPGPVNITGSIAPYEGQTLTYYHTGPSGSGVNLSNYQWSVTGGTVVSTNSSAKSAVIKWTSQGSRTITVKYLVGSVAYTVDTHSVSVQPPIITGTSIVTHGTTVTYTHSGQQSTSGYNWVATGGTEISENDGAKQATIRWDPTNGNSRNLKLYYNGSLLRTVTITVNAPTISGPTSALMNDSQTFTHNAGFANSGYTWTAGNESVSTNTSAKQATVQWSDDGSTTVRLFYNGYLLSGKSVSVANITLSGTNSLVHGTSTTYTHTGGGTLSNYNYTVNGGTIVSENDGAKQVTIRWTGLGSRHVTVRYVSTSQASQYVTVSAPTITGTPSSNQNGELTYTHSGGYASSNYTWSASNATVLSTNDSQKNSLIRWDTGGSQTISLYHSGVLMNTYNVSVTGLNVTGPSTALHGETQTFYHNGVGNLNNYSWTPTGGTMVSQNPSNKSFTVRWDDYGSNSLALTYNSVSQDTHPVSVATPSITGPDETNLDQKTDTYTHDAGGPADDYEWEVTGGTIISQDNALKQVKIRWESASATLDLKHLGSNFLTKNITGHDLIYIQATKGTNLQSTSPLTLKSVDTLTSYVWYKDDIAISSSDSIALEVTTAGDYYLKHTLPSGSERISDMITIYDVPFWDQEQNMIVSYNVREEGLDENAYETYTLENAYTTVNYLDGLSRPLQTIAKGQSFDAKDIVQPYQYDEKGRVAKSYLPYVADQTTGFYRDLALENDLQQRNYSQSEQQFFHTNDTDVTQDASPFVHTLFEDNPRSRVIEQGSVGADWQPGTGHTSRYAYRFNVADEVRRWNPDGTYNSFYPANTVYVVEMTDENDNLVETYTDTRGLTVLKRVQANTGEWLETYSIFDELGRLKYTISPEGADQLISGGSLDLTVSFIEDWVHTYTYDNRGRLVEQKVPGSESDFYVYDEMDRLILSQNAQMRANDQWSFVKYDKRNRMVYSGLYTNTVETSRAGVQGLVDALDYDIDAYYETPVVNATYHGYSNVSFPTTNLEVHAVVYYDSYDYDRNGTDDVTYDPNHLDSIPDTNFAARNGQVTGGKTRILGTNDWLQSTSFYDHRGRTIQSLADHHLGGTDKVSVQLNFQGQVIRTKATHTKGATTHEEERRFAYHANGTLLQSFHKLNDEPERLVSDLAFNKLGQLKEKNLYSEDGGTTFLQSVDYSYNIRGWLTAINDAELATETEDLFGMEISYNTAESGLSNTAYYNGNISAMQWSGHNEAGESYTKAYTYDYDQADRFIAANPYEKTTSWAPTSSFDVDNLSYDKNGNIQSIRRTDVAGSIADSLTYTYDANQLLAVSDAGSMDASFADGNTSGDDYAYDVSGNMTQDKNKGISSITYNHLNLPTEIMFESGEWLDKITYTYTAGGQKLKAEMWRNSAVVKTTDYAGSYHYEDDALQFIHYEEGQIMMNEYLVDYHVFLRDHQGNTRKVVNRETYVSIEDFEDTVSNFTDLRLHTSLVDNSTLPSGDGVSLVQSGQTSALGVLIVDPGDKVDLSVIGHCKSNPANNTFETIAYNTLASSFNGPLSDASETTVSGTDNAFNDALAGMTGGKNDTNTRPRAFLNYILFDVNMSYKSAGFVQIDAAVNVRDTLAINSIPVVEKGFLLVYLSNENQETVDMYFDELIIEHTFATPNLLQSTDYYPFGAIASTHTYLSEEAKNHLYNAGNELNDSTGYYETFYRNYDPTIGRFHSIDPVAAKYASITPYNYAFNDPVLINDPLGDDPFTHDNDDFVQEMVMILSGNSFSFGGGRISGNHWTNAVHSMIGDHAYNMNYMSSSNFNSYYGLDPNSETYDDDLVSLMAADLSSDEVAALGTLLGFDNLSAEGVWSIEVSKSMHSNFGRDAGIAIILSGIFNLNQASTGMTDFSNSNHALNIGSGIYGAMEGLTSSQGYWLGENGKYYKTSWGGNGATGSRAGALKSANTYKLAGKAVVLGQVALGGYMTYEGYVADGGQFGYNAQRAAVGSAAGIGFGLAGAQAGAAAGAAIGAFFGGVGAVPGAVIGGVIGGFGLGVGGSYLGSYLGESAVDYYHGR